MREYLNPDITPTILATILHYQKTTNVRVLRTQEAHTPMTNSSVSSNGQDCAKSQLSITTKKLIASGLILTPPKLSQFIFNQTEKRNEKNKHVLYSDFPDITQIRERVYWGIYSWTLTKSKRRWLNYETALHVDDMICSPTDIVRDYLDFYHPNRLRATGLEVRNYETRRYAPLYIHPTTIQDATYIDIKSTYYSIVTLLGWNVGYMPGQWLIAGRAPLDFPLPNDKPARNYLVSIGLPGEIDVWTGYRWVSQSVPNVHINLALWSVIMDILHSIASIAVALGAIYVHTDGYILPSERANELMLAIRQFRLTPEVRAEGPTILLGFANYMCGERRTKSFPHDNLQANFSNVVQTPGRWLRKAINDIADRDIAAILYNRSISC